MAFPSRLLDVDMLGKVMEAEFTERIKESLGIIPRGLGVQVYFMADKLCYGVAVWLSGTRMRTAVVGEALSSAAMRREIIDVALTDAAFRASVYTAVLPEQIAREVADIETVNSVISHEVKHTVKFKNGHTCTVGDFEPLSEYDHASLLMIYNLPPL